MIVVRIMGGLGNQMFQYATGRNLARLRNTELYLDLGWFDNIAPADTPRHYELDCFNLESRVFDLKKFAAISTGLGRRAKAELYVRNLHRKKIRKFFTPNQGFEEEVLRVPNNYEIEGWFQTEEYFKDIRKTLLRDFTYKKPPTGKNAELLKNIEEDSRSVALHVRRADFVTNKAAIKFNGTLVKDYYDEAVEIVERRIKQPNFYVFSDDIAWCKKNIKFQHLVTFIAPNKVGSEDMRLMRACRHNIIANSTFSWWGAWLNENPDKIVVAPKNFFKDPVGNAQTDIIPSSWQKI